MAANNIMTWEEFGPEFRQDIPTSKVRLKLGPTMSLDPDGTINAIGGGGGGTIPDQKVCESPFAEYETHAGTWPLAWTPTHTANTGVISGNFEQLGGPIMSPSCVTDATVNVSLGNYHLQLRDADGYVAHDLRLLVDGVPQFTKNLLGETQTNNFADLALRNFRGFIGSFNVSLSNLDPGAEITIELRRRYSFIMGNTATVPQARVRSANNFTFNAHFSPTKIVTGRL